jgi:hypothetical protein
MQFTTPSKLTYKFWKAIYDFSWNKVAKTEPKTIDIISTNFPTAFCLIIRYKILNSNEKFELIKQGNFSETYKRIKEDETLIDKLINHKEIILSNLDKAYKLE